MTDQPIRVLLIEDNPGDVRLIQTALREVAPTFQFNLTSAPSLSVSQLRLAEVTPDIMLLDLNLPDSFGLETLTHVKVQTPELPVVVLTDLNAEPYTLSVSLGVTLFDPAPPQTLEQLLISADQAAYIHKRAHYRTL